MKITPLILNRILSATLIISTSITLIALANNVDEFIDYAKSNIAITHVNVIDGTGSAVKQQTMLINQGKMVAINGTKIFDLAENVTTINGQGKTLIPGLVMMHEHLFYPAGKANYTEMLYSFPRLYLAAGVTTARTAGTTVPYADLALRDAINVGKSIGPDIDVAALYLNAPGLPILIIKPLRDAEDAKTMMNYWISEGVTSYKAYMHIHQDELAQVIKIAHQKKHKVTANLYFVTYREAAELSIDNLEHVFSATDFVKIKSKINVRVKKLLINH